MGVPLSVLDCLIDCSLDVNDGMVLAGGAALATSTAVDTESGRCGSNGEDRHKHRIHGPHCKGCRHRPVELEYNGIEGLR